jgi:hypothetical protein
MKTYIKYLLYFFPKNSLRFLLHMSVIVHIYMAWSLRAEKTYYLFPEIAILLGYDKFTTYNDN